MAAVDPTYPLYPIACIFAAVLLVILLLGNLALRRYNLSVCLLCIWLSLETLGEGVNAVIWSDNADIKLHVYCDIVSHLQTACYIVKPTATLIMARQLYAIASFRPIESQTLAARRVDLSIAYIQGVFIPVLVAGPFYYVVQTARFDIIEGFGCSSSRNSTILSILLVSSWSVTIPFISVIFYYPKVMWTFYRQSRDLGEFMCSANYASDSRLSYIRILALSSIDILLTLPMGITNVVLVLVIDLNEGSLPFYAGWTATHSDWAPISTPYAEIQAGGMSSLAQFYFSNWASPVLAFAIFGLFGLTADARESYRRIVCIAVGFIGIKSTGALETQPQPEHVTTMVFGAQSRATSVDIELGFDLTVESKSEDASGSTSEASRTSSSMTLVDGNPTLLVPFAVYTHMK